VAFTTSAPGCELADGLVFCRVNSRVTGRRMVSLPFSDHCEPLANAETFEPLLEAAVSAAQTDGVRYVELRPATSAGHPPARFAESATFWLHRIDLRAGIDELHRTFHKDCVLRKLRRAERESLEYEEGRSRPMLAAFYRLTLLTRRRHGMLPQPFRWFRNLADCLGEALTIRIASKQGRPIAGMITLRHKNSFTYKYGCSDARYNALGGVQFLFWHAIRQAGEAGMDEFDLGRTDVDQPGLMAFKDRWGSSRVKLTYWRCPAARVATGASRGRALKRIVGHMPDLILTTAGSVLYRHAG
jgi:hypothetical protein